MSDTEDQKLTALGTYIDGKMKRYSLLFSVNGGAFAIAKLMDESDKTAGVVLLGKSGYGTSPWVRSSSLF